MTERSSEAVPPPKRFPQPSHEGEISQRRDTVEKLNTAVRESTLLLGSRPCTLNEYRSWANPNQSYAGGVRLNTPGRALDSLADALFDNYTHPFTNPDTREVGFTPLGLLGYTGRVRRFTNKRLAARLVRAAVVLGSEMVVGFVRHWVGGAPAQVIFTRVLRGIDLPEPINLSAGARFELLPNNSREAGKYIHFDWEGTSRDLMNKPVLRTPINIDPVFYQPRATEHPYLLDGSMGWEGNLSGQEFAFDFEKYQRFLTSLSLACNTYVHQTNTWHEIPPDLRFITHGYSLPTVTNVPRFEEHPNPHVSRIPLTDESLSHAKVLYGQMERSDDLHKAVKDWEEGISASSARTRIERLRSVMSLLYNPGNKRPDVGKIVASNASNHLAPEPRSDRDRCFNRFLDFYKLASKVAHSEVAPDTNEVVAMLPWAYETLRFGILKKLAESS